MKVQERPSHRQRELRRAEEQARRRRLTEFNLASSSSSFLTSPGLIREQFALAPSQHEIFHCINTTGWSSLLFTSPLTRQQPLYEFLILSSSPCLGGILFGLGFPHSPLPITMPGRSEGTLAWIPYKGWVMRGDRLPVLKTAKKKFLRSGDVLRVRRIDTLASSDSTTPNQETVTATPGEDHIATTIVFSHNGEDVCRVPFPFLPGVPEVEQAFYPLISLRGAISILPTRTLWTLTEAQGRRMVMSDVFTAIQARGKQERDRVEAAWKTSVFEEEKERKELHLKIEQRQKDREQRKMRERVEEIQKMHVGRKEREAKAKSNFSVMNSKRQAELEAELQSQLEFANSPEQRRMLEIRRVQQEDLWKREEELLLCELHSQCAREEQFLSASESARLKEEEAERRFAVALVRVKQVQAQREEQWRHEEQKRDERRQRVVMEFATTRTDSSSNNDEANQIRPRPDLVAAPIPISHIFTPPFPSSPLSTVLHESGLILEEYRVASFLGEEFRFVLRNQSARDCMIETIWKGGSGIEVVGWSGEETSVLDCEKSSEEQKEENSSAAAAGGIRREFAFAPAFSITPLSLLLQISPSIAFTLPSADYSVTWRGRDMAREEVWEERNEEVARESKEWKRIQWNTNQASPLEDILAECEMRQVKFLDVLFPPSQESYRKSASFAFGNTPGGGPESTTKGHVKHQVQWRRLSSILTSSSFSASSSSSSNPLLSPSSPFSLSFGSGSSSSFKDLLPALLSSHPDILQRVFSPSAASSSLSSCFAFGCYKLRLFLCGTWSLLCIDDFLPCVGGDFSLGAQGEWRTMLLEKAVAKLLGEYSSFTTATPSLTSLLSLLTGAPIKQWLFSPSSLAAEELPQHHDSLGLLVLRLVEQGQLLLARASSSSPLSRAFGLEPGRSYGLTKAYLISGGGSQAEEIVIGMFLPHRPSPSAGLSGSRWSFSSPAWTPSVKSLISPSFSPESDGIYWLSWSEALAVFDCITVALVRSPILSSPWFSRSFPSSFLGCTPCLPESFYLLDISQESTVWFAIAQQELTQTQPQLIDTGVLVVSRDARTDTFSAEVPSLLQLGALRSEGGSRLSKGQYLIVPYTSGVKLLQNGVPQKHPFTLTVYSDLDSTIKSLTPSFVEPALGEKALMALMRAKGVPTTFGASEELGTLYRLEHGLITSFAVQLHRDAPSSATITLNFTKSLNAVSNRDGLYHTQTLVPGEAAVFLHLGPIDETKPCTLTYELAWK